MSNARAPRPRRRLREPKRTDQKRYEQYASALPSSDRCTMVRADGTRCPAPEFRLGYCRSCWGGR